MGRLLDLLGVDGDARDFAAADNAGRAGRLEAGRRLEVGAALPAPAPIFPRYVEPEAEAP
jgi:methionyl-tRNA synthetase